MSWHLCQTACFPPVPRFLTLVSAIACSAGSLCTLVHHVIMTLYRVALTEEHILVINHTLIFNERIKTSVFAQFGLTQTKLHFNGGSCRGSNLCVLVTTIRDLCQFITTFSNKHKMSYAFY